MSDIDRSSARAMYARVRRYSRMTNAAFNDAAGAVLDRKVKGGRAAATPRQWVKAATFVTTPCAKCESTGQYGQSGPCFACAGKGHQNHEDWWRNHVYWAHRGR